MDTSLAGSFAEQGYAVFPRIFEGELLALLRAECDDFVAREDARMDAAGTDVLGTSHRGSRYFANECQRERPSLRRFLFSTAMANVCRQTIGGTAYFFFDQYVVKGPEGGCRSAGIRIRAMSSAMADRPIMRPTSPAGARSTMRRSTTVPCA